MDIMVEASGRFTRDLLSRVHGMAYPSRTAREDEVVKSYLKIIGIRSWGELIHRESIR